ncbi:MAG: thioredoxin [Emcibacteraceae bacterium]|nr:thioredoxin [Emcibacteraceae bacterium]
MQDQGNSTPDTKSPYIIDVDTSGFASQVIEQSTRVPVLVDFWAPWCEPCKTLGPILEKVVNEAAGAVILAKVDIDQAQEIAAQMQIRSVPTVVAFVEGRPVDAFSGIKTETEIREFIAKIAPDMGPSEIEGILELAGQAYEAGNMEEAGSAYSQALQLDQTNIIAISGLANTLIKLGDLENADQVLYGATDKNHPLISAAMAALDTAKQLDDIGDIETLKSVSENNPDDHQARFDLALVLWATDQRDEAADHLLHIIATDKEWQDDGARKQLVKFFEIAGAMDPFTLTARRKLSSLLFS